MFSFEKEDDQRGLDQVAVLRKGFICGICGNFLQDAFNIPCGHTFCEPCIDRALTDKSMCPDCKNPAWQKDTRKAPQVDSAVQDWLASCEARYQALVVKVANEKNEDEVDSNFGGDSSDESDAEDAEGNNDQRRSVTTLPAQKVEPPNEESGETAAGAKKLDVSKITTPAGGDSCVGKGMITEGCVELEKENVELSPRSIGSSLSDPVVASFARSRVTHCLMSQAKPSPESRHHSTVLVDSASASPRENRREKITVVDEPVTPVVTIDREGRFINGVTSAPGKAIDKLEEKRSPLVSTTGSPSMRSPEKSAVETAVTGSEALSGKSGAEEGIFRFAVNLPDTCDVIDTPLPPSPGTPTNCLIRTPPMLKEDMVWEKSDPTLAMSASNVQRVGPLVGDEARNGWGDRERLRHASDGVVSFVDNQDREGAGDVVRNRCQLDASIRDPNSTPTLSYSRDAINDEDVGIASPTHSTRAGKAKDGMTPDEKSDNEEVRHDSQRDEEELPDPGRKQESPVGLACAADAFDDNGGGDGCATECEYSPGDGSDHDSLPLFFVADGNMHEALGKSKVVNRSRSQGVPSEGVERGEAMGANDGGLIAVGLEHEENWDEDDGEETCDEGSMEQDINAGSTSRRPTEATVAGNAALGNDPPGALGDEDRDIDPPLENYGENVDASKGPKEPPFCHQAGKQKISELDSRETTSSMVRKISATEHDGREMEIPGYASQDVESSHTPVTGETTGSILTCPMRLASETEISDPRDQVLERTKHPGPLDLRELRVEEADQQQVGRSWTKLPRSPMQQTPEVKPQKNPSKDEVKLRNVPLHIGDTLDEVRNTPASRQAIEKAGTDGCGTSNDATVCSATQEHSEKDGIAGTDDQDDHISETEMADQSFGTQEVPETELAGFQSALGDDSQCGVSVEWPEPTPFAPVKDSSLPESEIPETPQVQDSVSLSAPERDSSGDTDKSTSHVTPRAASCEAPEILSGRSSVTLSVETADIRAQSEGKSTHEGFEGSPGARGKDSSSRVGGGLRKSVELILSASDVSIHAESPEKKCKSTPPPVERSSVGDSTGGDEDHSNYSGRGCDASRRDSEEVGHDLAAAQDAWQAEGNNGAGDDYYEYAAFYQNTSDERERPGRPRSIEDGSSTQCRQIREVSNPYAPDACLELKNDDDPLSNATEGPRPDGGGASRENPATDGKTFSSRRLRHPLSRPSSATMSFGAPSRANTLVGPAVLGSANASARIRERDRHRTSNKILRAGKRGLSGKQESVVMTGSWLSYDMGPDTLEVEALEAGFAARREKRKPIHISRDYAAENEGRHGDVEATKQTPLGTKRPKGPEAKRTEGAESKSRRRVDGEGRPVIAVLGCEEWEIERVKQLCGKLGQCRLHLTLVWGVTHVVIGTKHTCDSGGERGNRHELVRHAIDGYHEAILLGLWVLDFAWVEACLKKGVACEDGRVALSLRGPPRDFELVGCRRRHKGCDPRRGRLARCSGEAGVFQGLTVYIFGQGRCEDEKERVQRLLVIGGAKLEEDKPSRIEKGRKETFMERPFDDSESGDDANGFGGKETLNTVGKVTVMVVLPDLSEDRYSQGLAKKALAKCKALKARAAVDRAWVMSSIEQCHPTAFDGYSVNRFLGQTATAPLNVSLENHQSGGSEAVGNGHGKRLSKCRLSLPHGKYSRKELVDLDEDFGQLYVTSAASDARRSKKIVSEAEKIMDAGDRVTEQAANLQPLGLGAAGFAFSRHDSKKKNAPEADIEPGTGSYTTYRPYVVAQEDLCKALHKVGYINMEKKDDVKISDFWSNKVYHGIFMRSSENAGKLAEERGCPLHVLQAEYDRHKNLQTKAAEARLSSLLEEFNLWKAQDSRGGKTMDEALEVL